MAKQPPKTRRKLSARARAALGKMRTCEGCGDVKEISERNFALHTKGPQGWHRICRVCQGVDAAETLVEAERVPMLAPITDFEDRVNRMYLLTQQNAVKNEAEILDLANELGDEIRHAWESAATPREKKAAFYKFVEVVKPLVAGWQTPGEIHEDIVDGLLSDHRRRLIIATRYSAKSTLTSIYVAFRIWLDPFIKVMVVSRGSKLAARMLRTVRRVYLENCPILWHLRPTEDCLDNAEQFQVPQTLTVVTGGVTLTSLGIGSNLPGFRADLTIGDDVEGPQDDTPEKVQEREETLNELHMINPRGEKVMLGTYQSEFSIYARLADIEGDDGEHVWENHRACMFEEQDDGTIRSRWRGMFSDKDALDWRRSVTGRAWKLHAMLIADPSILHEKPLRIRDFILVDHDPRSGEFLLTLSPGGNEVDAPTWGAPKGDTWRGPFEIANRFSAYSQTILAVDPASGLAARDAIGVAVLSITPTGFGVVRHLEGVRGPDKLGNIRRVAQIARAFSATTVLVEELADGLFGETLEGQLAEIGYPASVEKITTGGQQKGRRIIESLQPPMAAGRLVMLDAVARTDHGGDFVNQLVRISYDGRTGSKKDHDDIVDALAHAVAHAKTSLISDISDNIGAHHAERLERLRHVPTRHGGFGDGPDVDGVGRSLGLGRGDVPAIGGDEGFAALLTEEDEVMARLVARRDRLQEVVNADLSVGRRPEQRMINQIKALDRQIEELKGADLLCQDVTRSSRWRSL